MDEMSANAALIGETVRVTRTIAGREVQYEAVVEGVGMVLAVADRSAFADSIRGEIMRELNRNGHGEPSRAVEFFILDNGTWATVDSVVAN